MKFAAIFLFLAFMVQDALFNYKQLMVLETTKARTDQMLLIQLTEIDKLDNENKALANNVGQSMLEAEYYKTVAATSTLYCKICINTLKENKVPLPPPPTEEAVDKYRPMFLEQLETMRGRRPKRNLTN